MKNMPKKYSLSCKKHSKSFPRVHKQLEVSFMMGMLRSSFGNSIINTNPFKSVKVGSHKVVEHVSSFLD